MRMAGMEDLSLHILDVVENSIDAHAKNIEISICEDLKKNLLEIEIIDDGKGMNESMVKKAVDPFFTTKKVRRVGLGLSLFREAARMTSGDLIIQSSVGQGTMVRATFQHSHIDRKPLGDMAKTVSTLIIGHPGIRFKFRHRKNGWQSSLDTETLRDQADLSSMSTLELLKLVKSNLQGIKSS
jgi:DNA mismatch repair ATPase MutL